MMPDGVWVWRKFCCFMRRIETRKNDKPYVLIDAQAVLGTGRHRKTWWLTKLACITCPQIARRKRQTCTEVTEIYLAQVDQPQNKVS